MPQKNRRETILNDNLVSACRNFVAFKDALDSMANTELYANRLEVILRRMTGLQGLNTLRAASYSINPVVFVKNAIPFSAPGDVYGNKYANKIDPLTIISGTYHCYRPMGHAKNPDKVMDTSDKLIEIGDLSNTEAPYVSKIGDLPLHVSFEGKNRVSLFKKFRPFMSVAVKASPFPKPEDLSYYKSIPWGICVVIHKREEKVAPFGQFLMPILEAYGVKKSKPRINLFSVFQWLKVRKGITSRSMVR